ncbi:MAG: Maf family protein [Candidatus Dormibacteria bacterium]|jgi:septum formation protein
MTDSDEQLPGVRAASPFRRVAPRVSSAPTARIVLASSSPRRRELLVRAGIRFVVVEPSPDPPLPPGMCADLGCQLIARQKAVEIAERVEPGSFVVAADTVVVGPRGPLGKPGTPEAARRMLTELRGRRHTVLTGVCVLRTGTDVVALAVSRSLVKMRDFSDQDLITYVASGEPLDKAGAYAVQGAGGDLVEAVSGRVDTVVGLDVALTLRLLAEAGYPDPLPRATDVPLTPPRRERRPLAPMRAAQRV